VISAMTATTIAIRTKPNYWNTIERQCP
jgi:hypothetical protein